MMPHGSSQNNTVTILCIFLMEASIVSAHITNDDVRLAFELSQLVVIVFQHGMMPHGSGPNNTVTILCIFLMEASIVSAHITNDDL